MNLWFLFQIFGCDIFIIDNEDMSVNKLGVIVTLVPECVASSHNSPSMYQNSKIVPDCPLC